jgi:hypothetical protein
LGTPQCHPVALVALVALVARKNIHARVLYARETKYHPWEIAIKWSKGVFDCLSCKLFSINNQFIYLRRLQEAILLRKSERKKTISFAFRSLIRTFAPE